MEHRGEFPRRFNLTRRYVVWVLAEVEAWIEERKQSSRSGSRSTWQDVTLRRTRPVNGLIAVPDSVASPR
ncbi:helix-turn-helix transcriptional regulator [Ewingella americana]|uniref:helix-turn-helix transcriptional regulator n=1 Tax=Ewingella americana TaxID=41202 RepID=UPI00163A6C23|nr:AlpA family phage regulatory protein [Ewingella americana]QMV53754.1 AlpA family phage regulatory protein [Ewingella americana]